MTLNCKCRHSTRLKWTRGMGSSGHSPCKCLQCSRCHASISLSLHPLAMHHNQHTASLMVPTHLLQLRVTHRRQLKATHRQVTRQQVTPRPRAVHTLHLVRIPHLVPTPLRRATTESKVRAATGVVFVGEATEVS
uniref:Uncharacterized protein n=1 Tax=Aegilops tauschii subsp. strangulata TaxID=200361 RepID=A0A453J5T6_AEGTS